jgi:GAF domain-containing protein
LTHRIYINPSAKELERLKIVNHFKYLNFDLNNGLQGIVRLATELCNTPIALITLLDETNQYIKVKKGTDICMTDREGSFCTHTITQNDLLVVENLKKDSRFSNKALVTEGFKFRFYAGAPLKTNDGHNLGTLCVLDTKPKTLSKEKREMLTILSEQAMHLMELQYTAELLQQKINDIERQNRALTTIAHIQSHEFRSPVASILGLMNIIKDEGYSNSAEYFIMMEEAVKSLDEKIHMVVASTSLAKAAYIA